MKKTISGVCSLNIKTAIENVQRTKYSIQDTSNVVGMTRTCRNNGSIQWVKKICTEKSGWKKKSLKTSGWKIGESWEWENGEHFPVIGLTGNESYRWPRLSYACRVIEEEYN